MTDPSGESDTKVEGQRLSRIVEDYNKDVQVPRPFCGNEGLPNCTRYVFHFRASHARQKVCKQGRDDIKVKVNIQSPIPTFLKFLNFFIYFFFLRSSAVGTGAAVEALSATLLARKLIPLNLDYLCRPPHNHTHPQTSLVFFELPGPYVARSSLLLLQNILTLAFN